MNDGEKNFWNDIAHQLNPGWNLAVGQGLGDASAMLATHDTAIYLVDTSTFWITAASTMSSELLRVKRELAKAKLKPGLVAGAAGAAILECGARQVPMQHPDAHQAVTAAAAAITESATWTAVMDRMGSPAGHWTWLVYKLKTGEPLGRPLYGHNDRRGFMSLDEMRKSIDAALDNDILNTGSSVFRQVVAGGGVVFCDEMLASYPKLKSRPGA